RASRDLAQLRAVPDYAASPAIRARRLPARPRQMGCTRAKQVRRDPEMTSMPPPEDQTPASAPAPEPPSAPPPQYAAPQYAAPPSSAAAPSRPGMVTAAGVVMIIFGALLTLLGIFAAIGGAFISGGGAGLESQFPGVSGVTAGAV